MNDNPRLRRLAAYYADKIPFSDLESMACVGCAEASASVVCEKCEHLIAKDWLRLRRLGSALPASPAVGDVDKVAEAIAERLGLRNREDELTLRLWNRSRGGYSSEDMTRDGFIAELRAILVSMKGGG